MPGGGLPCASRAPRHVCRGPLERIFGLGGVASSPPSWPPPDPKGAPHEHHRKPDLPVLPGLPTLIGISPLQGSAAGGTQVTLTGTELFCAGVTISGQPPTNLFYNLVGTAPIATTPPGTPGPATVAVTNQIGSASLPGGFTYVAAATTLTATPAVIRTVLHPRPDHHLHRQPRHPRHHRHRRKRHRQPHQHHRGVHSHHHQPLRRHLRRLPWPSSAPGPHTPGHGPYVSLLRGRGSMCGCSQSLAALSSMV
ncbi:IPT/TIG domain-containing protein [Streptomyces sp. NPDC056669]|uniref:IPT/TIG domain-containing protein n=1 Tax=Streptomyces sp. NPDC056669 TaxID=3345903 RepID=UPI0036C9171C